MIDVNHLILCSGRSDFFSGSESYESDDPETCLQEFDVLSFLIEREELTSIELVSVWISKCAVVCCGCGVAYMPAENSAV